MPDHRGDAHSKQDHVEGSREVLTPHAERMHEQLHDITAADKTAGSGGANPGTSDNNASAGKNPAVDSLPKIDFYDSTAGGTGTPSSSAHMDSGTMNTGAGSTPADGSTNAPTTNPTATPTTPGA